MPMTKACLRLLSFFPAAVPLTAYLSGAGVQQNPPATPVNEFREEHYRRLEWASKRYFEGKAGWRTDRGRVYIMFGPPDFFETNPGGGRGFLFDPSGPTADYPSEVWTYRSIPGLYELIGRIDLIC